MFLQLYTTRFFFFFGRGICIYIYAKYMLVDTMFNHNNNKLSLLFFNYHKLYFNYTGEIMEMEIYNVD